MPITLRTLKKKSKQALPIMLKHYPRELSGEVFTAGKGVNYHGRVIRCTHGSGDPCLVKDRPRCECTWHPLKGTPMTGAMSGYYEPEWDEHTVLEDLWNAVHWTGRAPTMTDREWRRAMAVSGTRPVTDAEMAEWMRDDNPPSPKDHPHA